MGSVSEPWTHAYADLSEVRLHYVTQGEGPLVLLLHGFPELWYSWRHQIPALAAAGFRVVAPDMRGYNLSSKPPGVAAYGGDRLALDVAELITALGGGRAHVAGHDWGAMVAWRFAMNHPDRLDKLAILNVPHPVRFMKALRTLKQLRKSWYVFFFQLPGVPEWGFARDGFAGLKRALRAGRVRQDRLTREDLAVYLEAFARPGALTSAINYYRASAREVFGPRRPPPVIEAETLVIWGEKDVFLGAELAEPDPKWVPRARVVRLPEASHWVQCDAAEDVNRLLVEHFGGGSGSPGPATPP